MNELNSKLRDRAIGYGLCQQWQGDWQDDKSKQELIEMYIRGIDFCIANDYPSNEFIEEHFDVKMLEENHVYVNRDVVCDRLRRFALFNGHCKGTLNFEQNDVCDVYVKDDGEISINASGFSRISVNVYGNAKIVVNQSDRAKVFVYNHSANSNIECSGKVVVRDRQRD